MGGAAKIRLYLIALEYFIQRNEILMNASVTQAMKGT
jgi:hypothetical protein